MIGDFTNDQGTGLVCFLRGGFWLLGFLPLLWIGYLPAWEAAVALNVLVLTFVPNESVNFDSAALARNLGLWLHNVILRLLVAGDKGVGGRLPKEGVTGHLLGFKEFHGILD